MANPDKYINLTELGRFKTKLITELDGLYLGKTATAADSSKLNGQSASYYLNYNNLTNKPSIPTESTVSGWGFTKNAGTVIGSGLTANTIILGNGGVNIKTSSYTIAPSSMTWSDSDDTKLPTMKSIAAKISSGGGGTTRYLHTCTFMWNYVLDGSYRYTGSLSVQFTDDHAGSYQSAGAQYSASALFNFLKQHCFLNTSGDFKCSGGGYYATNSGGVRQEEQHFDSISYDGYGSWYFSGTSAMPTQSDKYPHYYQGIYFRVIPNNNIMLYDKVMEA